MRPILVSLTVILTLVVWSAANIMWGGDHHHGIIKADGKGYYAHLPAVFIYDDLNFGFYDSLEGKKYYNPNFYYDYRKYTEGKTYNKYYCGTAVAMLPFFLGAHVYALYSDNYEADGFSKPYNLSISIAAIAYMLAALWMIVLILRHFKISDINIAVVLPIMVFGTNWYYYVVSEPAVSHVYSVFFIAWFVYLGLKWGSSGRVKLITMAFLVGLITLIRPVNAMVILLVPFFFDRFGTFTKHVGEVFRNPGRLLVALLVGLGIVAVQLVIYKIQISHAIIYSYEEEGFNFSNPQIINVLFSYKKGLFLYTPVTLICLLGMFYMVKKQAWRTVILLLFLGIFTYVISSWWNWYYGGSFSSRVYLDVYALFAIPLGFMLNAVRTKWKKTAFITGLFTLVLFCQFQTFQYRHMIIHWDSMTKELYWDAFMNFDVFRK